MYVRWKEAALAVALLAPGAAYASDLPAAGAVTVEADAQPGEPRWAFTSAPYLWAASVSGNVGQFGLPTVHVDQSFSDIFKKLDFAAMFVNELRYGRAGLFTDFMYVKVSGENGTPLGLLATGVSVDVESLIFTAAGEYRIVDTPDVTFDLMAGGRVWSADTTIDLNGGLLGAVSASDGDTWVDALVGAKGRVNLTPEVYLTGWAMAGGGSSDFMWDVWGGLGYQFSDSFSAIAGYRGTGVDYEKNGFVFDVVQQGPVLGAVFRF